MVIDPEALIKELEFLRSKKIKTAGRLFISDLSHIVFPYHKLIDALEEEAAGKSKIGTTKRGIGPAYCDKAARSGIRMTDLLDKEIFHGLLKKNLAHYNELLTGVYRKKKLPFDRIFNRYLKLAGIIRPYVADTTILINKALDDGKKILLESAQGTMLDLDFGTYPYVTSSNPVAGGACTGLGIAPQMITRVLGICKAYTTRVGEGPFPTELNNMIGRHLRDKGGEYGATTGRPRRCGWFDAVVVRHAVRVNGFGSLALTKLDVLDELESIKICTRYVYKGKTLTEFPHNSRILKGIQPVYRELPGWKTSTAHARKVEELPPNTRRYLRELEKLTGVKVSVLSLGKDRRETIVIDRNAVRIGV